MMPNIPRKTRTVGLALLVVTFTVGASAGAAFDRILSSSAPADAPDTEERSHEEPSGIHEGSIFDHLELSPTQKEEIDAILARRKAEMDAIWNEAGPRMRKVVRSTNGEIRELLSAEQLEEFGRIRTARRRAAREKCPTDHETKERPR